MPNSSEKEREMTEEEAKTKWCPFARVAGQYDAEGAVAYNRIIGMENNRVETRLTRCLASQCMAWQWREMPNHAVNDGYCGLAKRE